MKSFFSEYVYLTVPILSWFIAQFFKFVFVMIRYRKPDFKRLVGSGGMPSGHSAFIVSFATVTAKHFGISSYQFGFAAAVAIIVMYDATGVRRAAGKQAEILNKIFFSGVCTVKVEERLKELIGHTPIEVVVGALLGIVLGYFLS
jgi:acid phosphatase family membrane protein YuiD